MEWLIEDRRAVCQSSNITTCHKMSRYYAYYKTSKSKKKKRKLNT